MSNKKENFWIPYADLMTVLMVIFLFISLAYMGLVQLQKKKQDQILEEYKETKEKLFNDLQVVFKNDFRKWNLELDSNLTIRFTNPRVFFEQGKAELKPEFKTILSEFFPKYLSVIMKPEYKTKISEIRIEGHTDTEPTFETDDPYIDNVILSQQRSMRVLQFLRKLNSYRTLNIDQEKTLQFWLTANGLSYGRTLDHQSQLTVVTGNRIDGNKSRRVEFRIVTTSDAIVQKALDEMK